MAFWIPGMSTCTHCGVVLQPDDEVVLLPPAWLEATDPMTNFREASFHRKCWLTWPLRQQFVARVNDSGRSGYRIDLEGKWEYIGDQEQ